MSGSTNPQPSSEDQRKKPSSDKEKSSNDETRSNDLALKKSSDGQKTSTNEPRKSNNETGDSSSLQVYQHAAGGSAGPETPGAPSHLRPLASLSVPLSKDYDDSSG